MSTVQEVENLIQQKKDGCFECSEAQAVAMRVVTFAIVACLAAQNGMYGKEQGFDVTSTVIFIVLYAAGDFALSNLTGILSNKKTAKLLAKLAIPGLALLSIMCGLSMMLAAGHQNDVANSRVAELERQAAVLSEKYEKYSLVKTRKALEQKEEALRLEKERVGAHASSNTAAAYLANYLGCEYETANLALKISWMIIFLLTSVSLSAAKSLLWTPRREAKEGNIIIKAIEEKKTRKERVQAIHKTIEKAVTKPKAKKKGWEKKTQKAYDSYKEHLRKGGTKLSIRKFADRYDTSTNTAKSVIDALKQESHHV